MFVSGTLREFVYSRVRVDGSKVVDQHEMQHSRAAKRAKLGTSLVLRTLFSYTRSDQFNTIDRPPWIHGDGISTRVVLRDQTSQSF